MKAKFFLAVILILGFLTAVSCNQGPIFFTISTETPPLLPLINGSPTNMVVFDYGSDSALYVASGRLYWYGMNDNEPPIPRWGLAKYRIPQPGGNIIALAVAGDYLYALCLTGYNVNTALRRIKNDAKEWEQVKSEAVGYPLIQSIYADPDSGRLFAGARQNSNTKEVYAVLYVDDSSGTPVLKILKPDTSILSGAAYSEGHHYLSTNGGGVFRVAEADLSGNVDNPDPLPDESEGTKNNSRLFMGMIKLKDNTIIAVERSGGALYKITDTSFEKMTNPSNGEAIATGRFATGALALWEGPDPLDPEGRINLLVAGIQGGLYNTTTTSYTYGYVEFDLNEDGSLNEDSSRREQGRLQSVSDNDRYTASIGKHSINHLFQAPLEIDANMTFFASTQIAGLWSYRNRANGGLQWNAEN